MSDLFRAEVLNQALPYIQQFQDQTFVVKYGGSAMKDPTLMSAVIRNVLLLDLIGIRVVLVHGGGPEIDYWLNRLGIEKLVKHGLRVTDDATMEVVEMALAGRANKALVAEIQKAGGRAVGLSGRDADLLQAHPIEELGRTGTVVNVDPGILRTLSAAEYIPVVCSVATSPDHEALNVNADIAAGAIAGALRANKLILLTDTDGVLEDHRDPATRISNLSPQKAKEMLASGQADRGMIPKLEGALDALNHGVQRVHLINGSRENSLLIEIFTDHGIGTMME
jgi:acetylglutamate kinase